MSLITLLVSVSIALRNTLLISRNNIKLKDRFHLLFQVPQVRFWKILRLTEKPTHCKPLFHVSPVSIPSLRCSSSSSLQGSQRQFIGQLTKDQFPLRLRKRKRSYEKAVKVHTKAGSRLRVDAQIIHRLVLTLPSHQSRSRRRKSGRKSFKIIVKSLNSPPTY